MRGGDCGIWHIRVRYEPFGSFLGGIREFPSEIGIFFSHEFPRAFARAFIEHFALTRGVGPAHRAERRVVLSFIIVPWELAHSFSPERMAAAILPENHEAANALALSRSFSAVRKSSLKCTA